MTTLITLSEEEFDIRFPLVENHLNPHAAWVIGDGRGCLFETYGEEFEFVRRQDPASVWTVIDGDSGDLHIVSGLRHANHIGFLVSREAVPDGVTIDVHIPMTRDLNDQPVEAWN